MVHPSPLGTGYVKFVRGTPAAFINLANKNTDTLYFISETGSDSGSLYLGDKLIGGGDADTITLSSLADVLTTQVSDKDILIFNAATHQWVNSSIDYIVAIMTGATETADGVAGLVPVPQAGDQDKFLRGDGVWAAIGDIDSLEVDDASIVKEEQALALKNFSIAVTGQIPQKDNLGNLTWVNPDTLKTDLSDVNRDISALQGTVGNMYTKDEIDLILDGFQFLKREIVESIDDIDPTQDDADRIIFLVPKETPIPGNEYDKYIVVDGEIELLSSVSGGDGSGALNPAGYVTVSKFNVAIGNINNNLSELNATVADIPLRYVTLDKYNAEVGDLSQLRLTQTNGDTLVDQVNDLTDRLEWHTVSG